MSFSKVESEMYELVQLACVRAVHRTGSNFTCDPPVEDTDRDIIVYVNDIANLNPLLERGYVVSNGNTPEGKEHYEEDTGYGETWWALRKGEFNLIATDDEAWYLRMIDATNICKRHNVRSKEDRITIFRWVRDGLDDDAYLNALDRWPV